MDPSFLAIALTYAVVIGLERVAEHRIWMIRAYAIGLGVATVRPIMGVFFTTSRLTLSLGVAEAWILTRRRKVD